MQRRALLATIGAITAQRGLPVRAEGAIDACPAGAAAGATCYQGHELEFDPADGPIQFLCVATTVQTTSTLDGQTTSSTATLVEYASDGDRYVRRGEPLTYAKVGVLASADVLDTFGIEELS